MTNTINITKPKNWLNIGLWAAQILLALAYAAAGASKALLPLPELAMQLSFVADSPGWLVRSIGVVELAGSVGILLPALLRIQPVLTPLAALGFSVIQVLAIGVHASYGETAQTLPLNLLLLGMSGFVLWGRWKKRPITPRH